MVTVCRICQSAIGRRFEVKQSLLGVCKSCGFVQVETEPTAQELEAIYSESYFSKQKYVPSFSIGKEYSRRLSLLKKYCANETWKVLDAGCATGDFVKYAKSEFVLFGHDISKYAIAQARNENPELKDRFQSGPLELAAYAPASFDAIALWDVIEHIWEPKALSQSLLKYLKPGGILFISTPNIGSLSAKVFGKKWAFMTPPEHLSFFTKKSFLSLFENQAGCQVLHFSSRGKWTTLGFVAYKFGRIFNGTAAKLLKTLCSGFLGRCPVYVPTGDVAYIVVQKPLT